MVNGTDRPDNQAVKAGRRGIPLTLASTCGSVPAMTLARPSQPRPIAVKRPPAPVPERAYTISQLAREFGVTPRALRFYEDKDLLHPARDGLTRLYSPRDRARLRLILQGKRIGLSLNDIRELLELYDLEDGQRAQMRASLEKFRRQVVDLEAQKQDIENALGELQKAIAWVEKKLETLGHDGPAGEQARAYDAMARSRLGHPDDH